MLVHDVLERAVSDHAGRVAVEDDRGERRTYEQLWRRAQHLAGGLRSLGLRPGDRVLEALPNSCAVVEHDMALAVAGLVRVPLNPRLGPREWAAVARDSAAAALVVGEGLVTADGARVEEHVDVPLVIGTEADRGRPCLEELVAQERCSPIHRAEPDDLVGLAYSSGTTGLPKGAMRTHRMRVASRDAMLAEVLGAAGQDTLYLHAGPVIHTSGLFVLPVLTIGGRQLLLNHARPDRVAATVQERGVTHLAVVPTVLSALASLPDVSRDWFGSVQVLAYAGAPIRVEQLRRAYDSLTPNLVQYYGLVEAMPPLSVLSVEDHRLAMTDDPSLASSAGRPLEHVEFEVRAVAGSEEAGEIAVRGDVVSPGYWNADGRADIGKAFEGGWLLTGDVGRLERERLWLTDRRGDMIISGGYNIYPGEVEGVVAGAAGVEQCCALGLPDPTWGQRLVVAVTTSPAAARSSQANGSNPVDAVAEVCRVLAPHKRPKSVHLVDTMPLGATGKIDRRALARQLASAT